mmetsp:Transcript_29693/g.64833  ORF Transcript_29693/g.64833 Transcript_29693/m.64833 type:complete len:199 (-) Transcript_29693:164-760(-)|eukprot:CAMPEP_0118926054 /NCGR_PEP_ID=MMETSP1169-20130426/3837_1 /TAXON_ID=36882 /ORGANISM="Pyramimonas obovata, Strain CCMP722" /LENGTH=198 /DNA_ID=CAMNT_0006867521 /DNA_START=59 /DNA_END=655 /DNA_ORIENTATION=-
MFALGIRTATSVFVQNAKSTLVGRADPTRAVYGLRMIQSGAQAKKPATTDAEFPTDFLGTPKNHDELTAKRPMSPSIFGATDWMPHYKFPVAAIASITSRVTGVMLSFGVAGIGATALVGDVGAVVATIKSYPMLLPPTKFIISYPFVYHMFAGFRHLYWDYTCKALDLKSLDMTTYALLGSSFAVSGALAFTTLPPV